MPKLQASPSTNPSRTRLSLHCEDAFAILIHPENDYHPESGLICSDSPDDPDAFYL